MAAPIARATHGRRRGMSEINMVPFIDVMLVLLIIFMVSAPLITTGVVDIPKVGASTKAAPKAVVEVVVALDGNVKLKVNGQEEARSVPVQRIKARVMELQKGNENVPVVISADRNVKYETVVTVMDQLRQADVKNVGLLVKQGG